MPRDLSDRILMRVKQSNATRKAKNLAAFLAQREQIRLSLADGWPISQIWETLHQEGKISTGYPAFCRQVNRWKLVRGASAPQAQVAVTKTLKPKTRGIGGFTFESTPNQEDLL
ncbi:MAG: TraK family protein [Nitrosospira sp.]